MKALNKLVASVAALSTWLVSSVVFAWVPVAQPGGGGTAASVPELDPTMAASALALLTAAALVVYGARKRS